MKACSSTFLKAVVVAVMLLAVVRPAFATFSGSNGHIAYHGVVSPDSPATFGAILLTDGGLLTTLTPETDFGSPAWSPDGSQLAFVRYNGTLNRHSINIIRRDGTGARELLGSEVFGAPGRGYFRYPAWSADGRSISFVRLDFSFGQYSIYTIDTDGSHLRQIIGPISCPTSRSGRRRGTWPSSATFPGSGVFPYAASACAAAER